MRSQRRNGAVFQCRIRRVPRVQGQAPAEECRVRALREFFKEAGEERTACAPVGRWEHTALQEADPQKGRCFDSDAFLQWGQESLRWLEKVYSTRRVLVGVKTCDVDSGRPAREGTLMP